MPEPVPSDVRTRSRSLPVIGVALGTRLRGGTPNIGFWARSCFCYPSGNPVSEPKERSAD